MLYATNGIKAVTETGPTDIRKEHCLQTDPRYYCEKMEIERMAVPGFAVDSD